jgi:DNA-binding CsgD family transcriptional regulator
MLRTLKHRYYLADVLNNLGWVALREDDSGRAKAMHSEGLRLRWDMGDKLHACEPLDGLASASVAQGEAERAARLFGVAEMLRELVGIELETSDSVLREPYLKDVCSQLEETAWQAAWKEGKAMGLEEAIEYALSEEESTTSVPFSPTQQPADKPSALTRRERQVASLVAQRLTNRQIASELVISERTVDHQVASILKKLGLHSREQVASRLGDC